MNKLLADLVALVSTKEVYLFVLIISCSYHFIVVVIRICLVAVFVKLFKQEFSEAVKASVSITGYKSCVPNFRNLEK